MRIETDVAMVNIGNINASPGRDAGCGLKLDALMALPETNTASPGRDAGCGLKRRAHTRKHKNLTRITRQRCRVRIETLSQCQLLGRSHASPGRDAGCGLKPCSLFPALRNIRITRQRCRVRIETYGRGSRQACLWASPGRDAGCGLKPRDRPRDLKVPVHHPAEMPGAD